MKQMLLLFMLLPLITHGQDTNVGKGQSNDFTIIHSNDLSVSSSANMILTGSVILQMSGLDIHCDSATYDKQNGIVNAYGNVKFAKLASNDFAYTEHIRLDIDNHSFQCEEVHMPWHSSTPFYK